MIGSSPSPFLPTARPWLAFLRKGQRLLIGAVGNADAFEADAEAGLVHHREHAEHAAIFLADQVTDGAALSPIVMVQVGEACMPSLCSTPDG